MNRRIKRRLSSLLLILLISFLCFSTLTCIVGIETLVSVYKDTFDKDYRACTNRIRSYVQSEHLKLFLTLSHHGRLGNWMFAYASLLGIAAKNKREAYIRYSHPLAQYFNIRRTRMEHAQCVRPVSDPTPCTYDKKFETLPTMNITIDGFVQSWKYFAGLETTIRKEFVFKEHIRNEAARTFRTYLHGTSSPLTVCVHVRRTDMLIPGAVKLGFKEAPKSYIVNAMEYMRRKFGSVKFIFISDDTPWCRANFQSPDVVVTERASQEVHLSMLTMCNHSIITTGTYGWWGAWLAGGTVVYYKDFPIPGTIIDRQFTSEDFFLPGWVGLGG
ncbi:galactoside 2-alpha-L-fucosyltransferase SEC1-like [Haliotis rufescens]|uniref:galactoside 2-alpha-L-fucosyltransferase SEC1-like n=1 Tax=Haliotis rufescens TaxID=6454 RepID=UPI001EB00B21|nr:galactoside 2-alpha-L-fucosyltransferase SEC1-like [Haliotis rufescens]XP_046381697.1 galactoside 2-alpha-L-fucosyltransferase SEC1-like [Haliotis rufescens]XP_046381698.1 galactoside 2-alpha-L-fucosyltransferase SEC1-like [Haliotis rufescens]